MLQVLINGIFHLKVARKNAPPFLDLSDQKNKRGDRLTFAIIRRKDFPSDKIHFSFQTCSRKEQEMYLGHYGEKFCCQPECSI